MNIIGVFALACLFLAFGIFGIKLVNITNILIKKQEGYASVWIFIGLAGYLLVWLFSLQVLASDIVSDVAANGLYRLSFSVVTLFMSLTFLLTIFEVLLSFNLIGDSIKGGRAFRERGVSTKL